MTNPTPSNTSSTEERIILDSSPEAAWPGTSEGWFSRAGRFYVGPDAERIARYDGCTHRTCECGQPARKGWTCCDSCRDRKDAERWQAAEAKPWGDGPVYADERYFQDEDEVFCYCDEFGIDPRSVHFWVTEPNYAYLVDADHWQDILPDDAEGELPDEIQTALNAFNKAITDYGKPLSWSPSKYRLEHDWSSVIAALSQQKEEGSNA